MNAIEILEKLSETEENGLIFNPCKTRLVPEIVAAIEEVKQLQADLVETKACHRILQAKLKEARNALAQDLNKAAESLLKPLKAKLKALEWIPVTEELPENKKEVLLIVDVSQTRLGYLNQPFPEVDPECQEWYLKIGAGSYERTHQTIYSWMPIPDEQEVNDE